MTPRQLEAYNAVMRSGSVSAAAAMLHISQPSVSRLISELEQTTGFRLFRRAGRGIAPTSEGRRFHLAVERLFLGLDGLAEAVERIRSTSGESITLGVIPALAQTVAPAAIADLRRRRSEVHVHMSVSNSPALVEQVNLRQYDLAVVSGSFPKDDLVTLYEVNLPYVCLVPRHHELAKAGKTVTMEQLMQAECIVMDQPFTGQSQAVDKLRERSGVSSSSMPAIAALARYCACPALVDPFSGSLATTNGDMVVLPLEQRLSYPYALISWHESALSLPVKELADELITALDG